MPNLLRLDILRVIREEAKISQEDAAKRCGLTGNQGRISFGDWERGKSIPQSKRRARFIPYLWDHLRLRNNPQRFEETWNILVEEWEWEPINDREWQELTSASRPQTVQSTATTLPATVPALPAPFQAPGLVSHFVGRSKEMAYLQTELLQNRTKLYALVGMGGIGKTTIAAGIAHTLRSNFSDGVLWGYAATSEPLDILNHWAKAFGCDFSSQNDLQNRAAAVRGLLADKHVLLVLDDVTSVDSIRPLLPNSQQCSVLLTTRSEEVAVGLGAQITRVDELLLEDGIAMLVQILGKERVEGEEEEARKICQRLNNLPLAVEIAAQYLKTRPRRSLAYLAERLDNAQQRLDLAIADRAVRSSFLVSWETLDAAQRTLFSHMALFAGRPFTAEALAAISDLSVESTQDQLESLATLSLLKEEGESHYRQHLLLADFAQEQLAHNVAQHKHARQQMTGYYLAFARENSANYSRLEVEWDNVMASMEAAYRDGEWARVIEYADSLTDAWLIHGEYERAKRGFAWAVEAAEKLDLTAALTQYHIRQGYLHIEQNQSADALRILRDALKMSEQLGDLSLLAQSQYHLARLALEQGDYEETDEQLSNCCDLFLQLKDELGWARATHLRAIMHYRLAEYAQCEEICNKLLAIYENHNDTNGKAVVLRLLTDIRLMQFDHEQTEYYTNLSMAHAKEHKIEVELGEAYINKAVLSRRTNAFPQAIAYVEQAIVLFQRTGKQASLANAYYEKSKALGSTGKQQESIDSAMQSLWIVQNVQDHYNCVFCLSYLGDLYVDQGNRTLAYNYLIDALELAKNLHHPLTEEIEGQLRQIS